MQIFRFNSLLLIVMLYSSCCFAQSIFNYRDFNWVDYEIEMKKAEKMKLIKDIDHWIINHLETYPFSFLEDDDLFSRFHIVDFDLDGFNDIIYYGPSGAEPLITIFLRNKSGEFSEVLSYYGMITNIWQSNPLSTWVVALREFECCDGQLACISNYIPEFDDKSELKKYRLSQSFCYVDGTLFPDANASTIGVFFRVINSNYKLRLQPFIPAENADDKDNLIAIFTKGTEGRAIAATADETGRIWWFVTIHNNIDVESAYFKSTINLKNDYHILGWMSSRYLEVIK